MSARDQEFLKSLRATFKIEAGEHLQTIATGLLELEKKLQASEKASHVEKVFRAAHSLKGAARAVNFDEVESICESLEDSFAVWKRKGTVPTPAEMDDLHRLLNSAIKVLNAPESGSATPTEKTSPVPHPPTSDPSALTAPKVSANQPVEPTVIPPATPPPYIPASAAEKSPAADTVRISVAKLDAQLLEAEEMLAVKLTAAQRASDLRELSHELNAWRKEWALVQPEMRGLRQTSEPPESSVTSPASALGLTRLIEFVDWNHDYFHSLENKVAALRQTAEQDHTAVGKLVDDLLADSKKMLMLPVSTLGAMFPKLVRDLCRDQGKESDLVIRGEEFEIDKRILEEMKDPFIHLLRNCVDHGIEKPEERVKHGKPPRATITIVVSPVNGNKVELLVSDDGSGIDVDKVKEAAIQRNLILPQKAHEMTETEALELIFQTDLSTSPIITQLSGRGLGLAIVREKTEKLGGRVSVESRRHVGTTIRIALPIAVATFRGILVEVAKRQFVVPTSQVERVVRFKTADIQTVEGRETLSLNGRVIALASMAQTLELFATDRPESSPTAIPAIILVAGDQRIAFAVDAVLDEQEVLVKRFSRPLSRVRNIAGATVLGSGRVAPILNVADLFKSAKMNRGAVANTAATAKPAKVESARILVVEDSITSRMLLKGILESTGYQVKTAVDGLEGFSILRTQEFDLVVSDVEMPRLNGFDLTARIRADKKLAELPVVLVTALESREDRERGIDAGADAYLVKSSFDQSNLLEAIRRLI
ncbi:MAG TPA: response regulator [Verrucomicrobiae bacterium]|jgi:two-component system chemotaxis sensor kinase CheA